MGQCFYRIEAQWQEKHLATIRRSHFTILPITPRRRKGTVRQSMIDKSNDSLDFVSTLSRALNEHAQLYLTLHSQEKTRSLDESRFEMDQLTLEEPFAKSTLGKLLQFSTSCYLFEAAHELTAIATLLESNRIAGSLELIARAVMERCGRVSWLLDHSPEVTPKIRAARIALEVSVSVQSFRLIAESLLSSSATERKKLAREVREIRKRLSTIFDNVSTAPDEAGQERRIEDVAFAEWVLDGVTYPSYSELATWAFFTARSNPRGAKGTYRALSASSHPSVLASQMHYFHDGDLRTYKYDYQYLRTVTSNSMATFNFALQAYSSYFDFNWEKILSELNSIGDSVSD